MKAKISYIPVIFGAIALNLLLILSLNQYIDTSHHVDSASCQFAEDLLPVEKTVFFAALIPHFLFLFSISEDRLFPFGTSAVSADTRGPPPLHEYFSI